jgi:hypothetical protein
VKQVSKWESKDGCIFDTEQECQRHEKFVDICERLDTDLCLRDISSEDIVNWMLNYTSLKL